MITEDTEGILDRKHGLSSVMGSGMQHSCPKWNIKEGGHRVREPPRLTEAKWFRSDFIADMAIEKMTNTLYYTIG